MTTEKESEPDQRGLVSRRKAAELLGVSKDTIRRMARKGELREVFLGGHSKIRMEDVQRIIEEGDGRGACLAENFDDEDPREEALTDAERNPSLCEGPLDY
jgi:excisionase family DNA binding protein